MPVFYFNLRGEGVEQPDLTGRDLPDEGAARVEAERLAAELAEAARAAGEAPPDAMLEVDDAELRPILALPLRGRSL